MRLMLVAPLAVLTGTRPFALHVDDMTLHTAAAWLQLQGWIRSCSA